MDTSDDRDGGGNVIDFGRRTGITGFNRSPLTPPTGGGGILGPVIAAQTTPEPGNGTGTRARRSPLDLLDALPSPTLSAPPVAAATSPEPGLPDTFRNTDESVGPPLGALSMAAVLAVAVAALRGSCIWLEDRRQRRMAEAAEQAPLREARLKHQLAMAQHGWGAEEAAAKHGLQAQQAAAKHQQAMQGIGAKAAEQRAKNNKVPSGQEFGRKTLGGGRGSTGGGGSTSGGKSTGTGSGMGSKTGPAGSGRGGKSPAGAGGAGTKDAGGSKPGTSKTSGSGAGKTSGSSAGTGKGTSAKTGGGSSKHGTGASGGSGRQTKKNQGSGAGAASGSGGGASKKAGTGTGTSGGKGANASKGTSTKSPHRSSQGAGQGLKKHKPSKKDTSATSTGSHSGGGQTGGRTRKERAAARQDGRLQRAAERQAARLQRRADRQAGRLKDKAKDRKAARDHKYGAKQARQETKDRIRNARKDAKEGRKEQVRQEKFEQKQRQRAQKAEARQHKKDQARRAKQEAKAADAGRTKLWGALKDDTAQAAADRWAKRGDRGVPPLWKQDKKRQKKNEKKAEKEKAQEGDTKPKPQAPKTDTPGGTSGRPKDRWSRIRDRARRMAGDVFGDADAPEPGPATEGAGTTGPSGPQPGAQPRTDRKSPFENAAATGPTIVTLQREDQPTPGPNATAGPPAALTRGIGALPPAPEPHTQRPGTTRPKEPIPMPPVPVPSQDPRLTKARNMAARRAGAAAAQARQMDAQHATEITLDDACDAAEELTNDAFTTHDESARLAAKARKLRETWLVFADDLARNHNLIGPLFTAAALRFAESMEVLAAMADEMQAASLGAAEKAETAGNEINDAYRPYNVATADAGLSTPSAPIHNEM